MEKIQIPKIYLTVNKKHYRAVSPLKALLIARKLKNGVGDYKIRVIYGVEQISKRKRETIENSGKYQKAREARLALTAFLNKDLWLN